MFVRPLGLDKPLIIYVLLLPLYVLIDDFLWGLRWHYPICCIADYVWSNVKISILQIESATETHLARGSFRVRVGNVETKIWVPCRWHMGKPYRGLRWRPNYL